MTATDINTTNTRIKPVSEQFPLIAILKCDNLPDLFRTTKKILAKTLKGFNVEFLLMDRDFTQHCIDAGVRTEKLRHAQFNFTRVQSTDKRDFKPGFDLVRETQTGFIRFSKKFLVWPVRHNQADVNTPRLFLMQLQKSEKNEDDIFEPHLHYPLIEGVAEAFLQCYSRMYLSEQSKHHIHRAFEILNTCKLYRFNVCCSQGTNVRAFPCQVGKVVRSVTPSTLQV